VFERESVAKDAERAEHGGAECPTKGGRMHLFQYRPAAKFEGMFVKREDSNRADWIRIRGFVLILKDL
jgi:hypothetical protein